MEDNLPHVIWPSERWAYDLVKEPYDMKSKRNEDYGIWNKEVHSPVSGIAVAALLFFAKTKKVVKSKTQILLLFNRY